MAGPLGLGALVGKGAARQAKRKAPKKKAPAKRSPFAGAKATGSASVGSSGPRQAPRPSASVRPAPNLVTDTLAAVQAANGRALSPKKSQDPAAVQRAFARRKAQSQRQQAVAQYASKPRAERSRIAAAANRRVSAGRGSTTDKLIVQTHARRTRNDSGRSRGAVSAANDRHDRVVRAQELSKLIDGIGRSVIPGVASREETQKQQIDAKLKEVSSGSGIASAVRGASDVTNTVAKAAVDVSKFNPFHTGGGKQKYLQQSVAPGDAVKAAVAAPVVIGNIASVVADDPTKQIPLAVKDIAGMVKDLPAGVIKSAQDPAGAFDATKKDIRRRYGPLMEGNAKQFRERMKKEGVASEVVDALGLASGESTAAARATSGLARGFARTTRAGSRVNRAANAVVRHVNDPRPDKVITTNVAKPQRKSGGLVGVTAQRVVDKRRAGRVNKEVLEAAAKRGKLPASTPARKARKLDRTVEARERGNGVRGVLPQVGQVAARKPRARDRAIRKQTAVVASVGFRRLERLQNELTRDAEQRFQALSKTEQRAAVHALEGTINPADPVASVAAIDRRVKQIQVERATLKRDDPVRWEEEYAPLLGKANADEVVQLAQLRESIESNPKKVLSPRLQKFVEGEQQRRPRVEKVAGDSLRPSTVLARRFAPAGELTGTRMAYAPRRSALERLETMTPRKALEQIGKELKTARTKRADGRTTRRALELAAEARAVQQIVGTGRLDRKIKPEVLDRARTIEAETFVRATREAARKHGLGDIEPVFVKHRKRDTAGAGMRAVGGAERGAVAGAKKSDLSLFRRGFRDTSDRAYALGMQESAKRSVQWRMVNELVQDHVPKWSRGKDGKGLTLKQFELAPERKLLDPQDWVAWRAGREEAHPDSDLPDDTNAITEKDTVSLADIPSTDWAVQGERFFAIPMSALNEMKRSQGGSDSISRVGSRVTGVQSQMILGSNPAYGVRQVLQTLPLTTVAVGGRVLDVAFWRNLKAYRRAAKVNPEQWNDVLDVIGVRSKSADAVRSVKRGDKLDTKRFEGALTNTWGGLFGAKAKDYFVSPRRSGGPAGTASQAARTTGKVAMTPFRLVRDGNMMLDAWQDRFARTLALAAKDAKMAKGSADRFAWDLADSTTAQAKRIGPLAAAMDLPPAELEKLARTPEFRHMAYEAADGVTKWLGDYANYTQLEQKVGRAFVPFYGFARHSTRLLVYTLPVEHPFVFAAVLSQAGVQRREKEQMLRDYMKKIGREGDIPAMLDGLVLTANGGGILETVDARWLNPLTGPVFEALSSDPATATTGIATPLVKGFLETSFETNAFTKQRLSNADGMSGPSNKLSGGDKLRVVTNRLLSSMFPYRAWNDLANGEKGKLTDTSLAFDPQPYPYKPTQSGKVSKAGERNAQKIKDAKGQGDIERLLDSVVPFRRKPTTSLLNSAEYEAQNKKGPKKAKAKKSSGGGFGGGGFGGSSGFGGGGF